LGKVRIEGKRSLWESPMANKVTHVAVALRESMEELGWTFGRERSERIYTRFSVILPMPKVAYVFRFRVTEPLDDVVVDTWEMRMTHRGDISFLSVDDYQYEDLGALKRLMRELVERLPRRPWDFPLGQRLEAGLWIPEWTRSRTMWQRMGFDVSERTPKDWIPRGSLGEQMRSGLDLDVEEVSEDGTGAPDEAELVGREHEDQG
jgi:hypothetical protein